MTLRHPVLIVWVYQSDCGYDKIYTQSDPYTDTINSVIVSHIDLIVDLIVGRHVTIYSVGISILLWVQGGEDP